MSPWGLGFKPLSKAVSSIPRQKGYKGDSLVSALLCFVVFLFLGCFFFLVCLFDFFLIIIINVLIVFFFIPLFFLHPPHMHL